jgi:two-component system LytT family sensor kinase
MNDLPAENWGPARSRGIVLLSHGLGLLFFFSIPIIFLGQQFRAGQIGGLLLAKPFWIFFGTYVLLFYFHSYFLIPRFFLHKKIAVYAGILALLFAGVFLLKPFDKLASQVGRDTVNSFPGPPMGPGPVPFEAERPPGPPPGPPRERHVTFDIVSLFLFGMVVALNLAVETSRQWRHSQRQALKAEADKVNAELSFLKAQINPHFLFNTLNNIYALVVTHNEHAGPAILKLSNIMRYVTDEVQADFVPLQHEVNCLQDYIELHRLRLGKMVELEYSLTGAFGNKTIAPLVLVTFVENAFKYGISNHERAPITIQLKAETDQITFFCQNKIFHHKPTLERSGVGIANIRERLQYLYPGKHDLSLSTEGGLFTVNLILLT